MTNMGYNPVQNTQVLVEATAKQQKTALKLTWKSDEPVWTEQWPFMKEKLQAAKGLIDTQVELKHIEESCSPWNSPIFAIKKKSNKWHLLTDIRRRQWHPTSVLLPGKSHGRRSLVGCNPWGC